MQRAIWQFFRFYGTISVHNQTARCTTGANRGVPFQKTPSVCIFWGSSISLMIRAVPPGKVGVIFFGSNKKIFSKEKKHIHPQKNGRQYRCAQTHIVQQRHTKKNRNGIVCGTSDFRRKTTDCLPMQSYDRRLWSAAARCPGGSGDVPHGWCIARRIAAAVRRIDGLGYPDLLGRIVPGRYIRPV